MPELPEVETVVRDLRPLLMGRKILTIETSQKNLRRAWNHDWSGQLEQSQIKEVNRRGKWIIVKTDNANKQPCLLLHLGMTGQMTVHAKDETRQDHTHLIFELDNKTEWRFRDVRRFGSADLFASVELLQQFLSDKLGPEPIDTQKKSFAESIQKSTRCLKALLLDQSIVAGVGNIYADEACFRSQLLPDRLCKSLSVKECEKLRLAIIEVITLAIEGRGSTIKDYIGGSGLMGTYQGEFRVYGRTNEECIQCGTLILMQRLSGRSSHFCPQCQK